MFLLLRSCLYLNTFPSIVYTVSTVSPKHETVTIHNITICLFWTRGQLCTHRGPRRAWFIGIRRGIQGSQGSAKIHARDPRVRVLTLGSSQLWVLQGSRDPCFDLGIQPTVSFAGIQGSVFWTWIPANCGIQKSRTYQICNSAPDLQTAQISHLCGL